MLFRALKIWRHRMKLLLLKTAMYLKRLREMPGRS